MCDTCGCGHPGFKLEGVHEEHHHHDHPHTHAHHEKEMVRTVQVERDLMEKNDGFAAQNRKYFSDHGIFALNLISSPGAGKTTLLVRLVQALKNKVPIAVVEGDQETTRDAERIRQTGVSAIQINTGKGCHLDALMLEKAIEKLEPASQSLFFIENVGNLVCPAEFDLGESCKVLIMSTTEGDDKPLKYPNIFHHSRVLILNKIDLLPYVPFDVERCISHAKSINPELEVFQLSAHTGEGLEPFLEWIRKNH